jgi:urocanate hydratase
MLNAGRKYMGTEDLAGKVFVSSGLGGMSGAQPKAAFIAGCIAVIAEVAMNTCSFLSLSLSLSLLFVAGPE